ncbi:hypothetical protein INT47_008318 [Mucor saturninus]|uniref:Uncharacterized protein n=1 Tax=Mucor saturninus TaxID=64648 RepID=A0A8H7RFN4_9FUNG|nr:hypothetical protein INT47_008318 [Mucor saturninus]
MYKSVTFEALTIDLSCVQSEYYDILNSPSRPGQWVTSFTFQSFRAEENYTANITETRLYHLMMFTPHVKVVQFDLIEYVTAEDWDYFYKVLKTANVWKLRCLPDDWNLYGVNSQADLKTVYSTYIKCTQHLKHSLRSVRLIKQPIPTNIGPSFIHELVTLTSLHITEGYLKTMSDLDILLQYTPQLEELSVDFTNTRFNTDQKDDKTILNGVYPSIRILTFHDYVFQTDNQVCVFNNNFTGLRRLHITCFQNKLSLNPEITDNFFMVLASLSSYHIHFSGNTIDISDFIIKNCRQKLHVSVNNNNYVDEDAITISKTQRVSRTMINYKFHHDYSNARHILSNLGPNVQQFELGNSGEEVTQEILGTVFSSHQKNIHALVFQRLKFKKFDRTDSLYTSCIQSITFNNCQIYGQFLEMLSAQFTKLSKVRFKGYRLIKRPKYFWADINMPSTDFHTLCISYAFPPYVYLETMGKFAWYNGDYVVPKTLCASSLVSITYAKKGTTKYYYTRNKAKQVLVETAEPQFYLLLEKNPDVVFIKITVKSIRRLLIKPAVAH